MNMTQRKFISFLSWNADPHTQYMLVYTNLFHFCTFCLYIFTVYIPTMCINKTSKRRNKFNRTSANGQPVETEEQRPTNRKKNWKKTIIRCIKCLLMAFNCTIKARTEETHLRRAKSPLLGYVLLYYYYLLCCLCVCICILYTTLQYTFLKYTWTFIIL